MGDRQVVTLDRDGHRLALHVSPAVGDGTAALILPALGVPARKYFALGDHLGEQGLAAGVLDLRGQGDSRPRPSRSDTYGYADLAGDVTAAVAALRARTDRERVLLVGHSLGGQLALIHAALVEPIDVVLVGVALPYWRDYRGAYRWALLPMSQTVNVVAQVLRVSPRWSFGGAQSRGVMADWAYTARRGRWPKVQGADPMDRLAAARFRLLGVHVEHDDYAPRVATERLMAAASSARTDSFDYTRDLAGAPLDHFTWLRAAGPLSARIGQFAGAG